MAELGSIAKAAKATGFSYKTTWDSVNAVNNLLPSPAFLTRPGGRSGGGAKITEEGRRLITTFRRLEKKLSLISNLIAEEGVSGQEEALLWAVGVRISARNVFQTEVAQVKRWPVDVKVMLKFGEDRQIMAVVTNEAADDLELQPGRKALALVKAPFIRLYSPDDARASGTQLLPGAWRRDVSTRSVTAKFCSTSVRGRRCMWWRRASAWRSWALRQEARSSPVSTPAKSSWR